MIVLDSSALVSVILEEEDARLFADRITEADALTMSAVTLFETRMVLLARRGEAGLAILARLIAETGFEIVPFDAAQAALALDAFRRYGKGRHQARLNLGDYCTYALAKARAVPLLYKGTDFAATDLASAT